MVLANAWSTTKPWSARRIAGAMSCCQDSFFEPSVFHPSQRPATLPGTPDERHPSRESPVDLPSAPTYMSRRAAAGATSRKSSAYDFPPTRATRKPPPPMFPAVGNATARAKAIATAASTALPPDASTSAPTLVASALSVTTMAPAERGDAAPCGYGQSGGKRGGAGPPASGGDGVAVDESAAAVTCFVCPAPAQ